MKLNDKKINEHQLNISVAKYKIVFLLRKTKDIIKIKIKRKMKISFRHNC